MNRNGESIGNMTLLLLQAEPPLYHLASKIEIHRSPVFIIECPCFKAKTIRKQHME